MLNVLIIHAHSEADSFVAAMRDEIVSELTRQGANISLSDLYAMEFNPVLSARDFLDRKSPDHLVYALEQRHGYESGTLAPDIAVEVEKVNQADLLIFTFPVFWFSVPAIMKGWIDRVFLSGLFYGGKRIYGKGGLAGKRAFVATSLGGREDMFGENGIHGEFATGMLRHFFIGSLGYVGLSVYEPFVAYHVPYLNETERKGILEDLREVLETLKCRPLIAMPDLGKYTDSFAPK